MPMSTLKPVYGYSPATVPPPRNGVVTTALETETQDDGEWSTGKDNESAHVRGKGEPREGNISNEQTEL